MINNESRSDRFGTTSTLPATPSSKWEEEFDKNYHMKNFCLYDKRVDLMATTTNIKYLIRSLFTSHSEAIRERVEGLVEQMNWDIAACSQFPESESHTYAKVYMQSHRDDILALLTDDKV